MRIVVIDPSRTVLKCIGRLLEARAHRVHAFTDGSDALRYIASDKDVDAAIISAEQVGTCGIELCWQARLIASSSRPLYIVLMSTHDARRTLAEALDGGADDFIAKPPATEELYARLRAAERMNSMQRELTRLATTDPLTGVLNRRAFFERFEQVCEGRPTPPISAIMMDIDHFKRINDEFGHSTGDLVIRAIAAEAAKASRIVGRLGGEEFAVICEANRRIAKATAERLRETIERLEFRTSKGPLRTTCSFGVSEWRDGDTVDELLRRADLALYAAKEGGRNRVVADYSGLLVMGREERPSLIRTCVRAHAG